MWHTHTIEHLVVKGSEVPNPATAWMDLQNSMEGKSVRDYTVYDSIYKKYPE